MQDSTGERETRHDARERQIAAEAAAYKGFPHGGGNGHGEPCSRSLYALVADAVSGEDGDAAAFMIGALHALADDLAVLHLALEHAENDNRIESGVAWRLAERARAVAEIASRKRALERASATVDREHS